MNKRLSHFKVRVDAITFPNSIKGAIIDTGFTQKQCAEKMGISKQFLSEICNGKRISIKVLNKLALMAGIEPHDLYEIQP